MGASSDSFRAFVEEQLASLPELRCRRMFGGHGLYAGGVFFGILHGERLFFRTNERTRKRYEACGMECFTAPGSGKALKHYYEVPFGVVENRLELIEWALESIGISGI